MNKKTVLIVSVVGIVLLVLIGYLYFNYFSPSSGSSGIRGTQSDIVMIEKPVTVTVTRLHPTTVDETISAVGSTVSKDSVILSSEIAGRISKIRFDDGSSVRKGTVLIELDASTQQAEVRQARANADLARINDRRTQELSARNFVSKTAADEAKYKLKVAEADLALAEAKYQKTLIRAPFDGILGIRKVSVGDYIQAGDPLINIEDINSLNVDFQIPEAWLQRLRVGLPVTIESDSLPNESRTAIVQAIDPQIHPTARSFSLRARVMNLDHNLKPGMFVRVTLRLGHRVNALMVPESAISAIGTDQFVYQVIDGRAQRARVTLGIRKSGEVEITSGLEPNAVVITAGHQKLRDNQLVISDTEQESL